MPTFETLLMAERLLYAKRLANAGPDFIFALLQNDLQGQSWPVMIQEAFQWLRLHLEKNEAPERDAALRNVELDGG